MHGGSSRPNTEVLLDKHRKLLEAAAQPADRWAALNVTGGTPITRDDVLIVVDMQNDFLPGGAFGVAEGNSTVPPISVLIQHFANFGCRVFATRDYHPADHCSFNSHGGPFPAHCVQNTTGSHICTALQQPLRTAGATIVFKGFSKDVDSFGALPYQPDDCGTRVSTTVGGSHCGAAWTGSFVLFSSTAATDINAPPDVMAVLDRVSLASVLESAPATARLFVVGLAMDFCVLDTACNAAANGFKDRVFIVPSATRAVHIDGVGAFGSGFLSDPAALVSKIESNGIKFTEVALSLPLPH